VKHRNPFQIGVGRGNSANNSFRAMPQDAVRFQAVLSMSGLAHSTSVYLTWPRTRVEVLCLWREQWCDMLREFQRR